MSQKDEINHFLSTELPKLSTQHPIYQGICKVIEANKIVNTFKINKTSKTIQFNGQTVSLEKKKKLFRVFESFHQSPESVINRSSLVNDVYLENQSKPLSDRQNNCHNHNVVKLISRARKLAKNSFDKKYDTSLDWFPYDPYSKTWILNRAKPLDLNHAK